MPDITSSDWLLDNIRRNLAAVNAVILTNERFMTVLAALLADVEDLDKRLTAGGPLPEAWLCAEPDVDRMVADAVRAVDHLRNAVVGADAALDGVQRARLDVAADGLRTVLDVDRGRSDPDAL